MNAHAPDYTPAAREADVRAMTTALVEMIRSTSELWQMHGDFADMLESYMDGHTHQFQGSESQSRDVLEVAANDLLYSAELIATRFQSAANDAGMP